MRREAEIETALKEGKRYDVIAKELRVSTKTIAKVAKKMSELSPIKAVEMFEQGKSAIDVVKETNEDITKIANWYKSWVDAVEAEIKYEGLKEKHERIKEIKEEQSIAEEALKHEGVITQEHEEGKGETSIEHYRKMLVKKG